MLEGLFDELELQWARHKKRGPTRVIDFLGMLLVNLPERGLEVISLTRERQSALEVLIDKWLQRRPWVTDGDVTEHASAEPRELASLLGTLVFCSEVIPGGRTYMQGMLRQFAGLEVDWIRGRVRYARGRWRAVPLSDGFWRDLSWWRSALRCANCIPFRVQEVGVAAVVGTDASDYACGELVWLDGAREEMVLTFTDAERRRPINFRELLGVVRLVERWGARLEGRTLLIDIDNTAAVGSTDAWFSRAEDMQELVRRLLDVAQRFRLTIRPVHTPGELLHRPDQTSRGDQVEEPRLRFRQAAFRQLEGRYGPFSELLGAEHEFGSRGSADREALWLHPTFRTVATAL